MARPFAKVFLFFIKTAFSYPSDLVNTKTTIPSGSVKSGGYIPRRFASRYTSTTIHLPPSGDSCIIFNNYSTRAHWI